MARKKFACRKTQKPLEWMEKSFIQNVNIFHAQFRASKIFKLIKIKYASLSLARSLCCALSIFRFPSRRLRLWSYRKSFGFFASFCLRRRNFVANFSDFSQISSLCMHSNLFYKNNIISRCINFLFTPKNLRLLAHKTTNKLVFLCKVFPLGGFIAKEICFYMAVRFPWIFITQFLHQLIPEISF